MKKRIIAVVMMLVMVIACPFAVQSASAATDYETLLEATSGQVSNSTVSHSFSNASKRKVFIDFIVSSSENVNVSLTNLETSEKIDKSITSSMWDYDTTYGCYTYSIEYTSLDAGSYQVDLFSTVTVNYAIMVSAENKVMTISSNTATITAGQKKTLKVTDAPGTVKWKSSKTSVATVSSKGVVTAKKAGKATITATSGDQKITCKVTVKKNQYSYTKLSMNNAYTGYVTLSAHKAYYKNGKIVCNFNIVNKTMRKVTKFKYITITVKTSEGKTIAKQKFSNLKWSMSTYSKKSKSLTISKKNVKKKSADLRNAVITIDSKYVYPVYY